MRTVKILTLFLIPPFPAALAEDNNTTTYFTQPDNRTTPRMTHWNPAITIHPDGTKQRSYFKYGTNPEINKTLPMGSHWNPIVSERKDK